MSTGTVIELSNQKWIYVYAFSRKEKKHLVNYYKKLFPREYVRKLIAEIGSPDVQSSQTQDRLQ